MHVPTSHRAVRCLPAYVQALCFMTLLEWGLLGTDIPAVVGAWGRDSGRQRSAFLATWTMLRKFKTILSFQRKKA
ncbi:hypothetical protein VUR80DRAFT_5795 [Thermomyces stellatus]